LGFGGREIVVGEKKKRLLLLLLRLGRCDRRNTGISYRRILRGHWIA